MDFPLADVLENSFIEKKNLRTHWDCHLESNVSIEDNKSVYAEF